jgi:tyrosyl-tRNA synthetase
MPQTNLLTELRWRGLVYQHTEGFPEALERTLTSAGAHTLSGYCGFDPTAPSLHIGNLVQIMGLVHLQRHGHRPVALVGGGTGMIGDPSGKSVERTLQTREQVETHVAGIRRQLEKFLDFSGPSGAVLQDNAEWLLKLGAVEFMRDVGKHFTVNYMLAKDSVKSRIEGGISYTEFSYMLLQAYDFLQLNRLYGVTLQTGGSDQWGNITAGIELIRRTEGREAHGLTLPLVTTASGAKFGKTESGTIWLDAKLTSPYKFFQFWINTDDRDVGKYLRYFTLLSEEEIQSLDRAVAEHPERREAQSTLAQDVTTRVHGAEATRIAMEASGVLFGKKDPKTLSADVFEALAQEVPSATIKTQDAPTVVDLFVQTGLTKSKGEARRLADQGGTYVNGERTPGATAVADLPKLAGSHLLLRKGARDYAIVKLTD